LHQHPHQLLDHHHLYRWTPLMYHCQLRQPHPPILLTTPCVHHHLQSSAPLRQGPADTTSYHSSAVPYPLKCRALSSPFRRNTYPNEAGRDPATAPALAMCKTYAMPWQTCSACPHYPFHSLLLIDPPPLWQPYPRASHDATSRASPLQSLQSLRQGSTRQNPKKHVSNQTPGISRIQPIPSIDMALRRPTNNGSTKHGRKPTTAQNIHCRPAVLTCLI
jgi:hypothetical protein